MGWLAQYGEWLEVGSLFFALAAGSYYLAPACSGLSPWDFREAAAGAGRIFSGGQEGDADSPLCDTGNSLKDPFTGSPSASWRGRRRRSCFRAGCRRSCGISRTAQLEGRMECFRL